jgi:hypothetical protein
MEEDRGPLLTISNKRPNMRAKEADLQKLRQPPVVVAVVDEQEKASIQDIHDPYPVALTNPKAVECSSGKEGSVQAARKGVFKWNAPQRARQLRMRCAPLSWRK